MDDLLQEFIAETREMLTAVQEELVVWEADPADRARLDAIFRFVHTVKGNCGFFDLPRLAALSHAAETALADVRGDKRAIDTRLVDAIFAVIDRIGDMIDMLEAGETIPEGSDEVLIRAFDAAAPAAEDMPGDDEPEGPQSSPQRAARSHTARSIRLPVPLLDRVMAGISDVVLVRNELARHLREGDRADGSPAAHGSHGLRINQGSQGMHGAFARLSGLIEDLRQDISQMRMHRLDHLYAPLPRLVRDLSSELGKSVQLEVEGGQVELDREVIELVRDPLVHILRNAIDHGIEPPAERIAAGKPEAGLIQIFTRQTGNRISIAIADDGAGIDIDRLCRKAVEADIATAQECAAMDKAEALDLIFEAGISTAASVTSISGRGVGMDVVRANIERLGGEITVSSEAGEGTRLFISLPATLSIVPSLTVQVVDHRFGVPRTYVESIISSRSDRLVFSSAGGARLVEYHGQKLRCSSLANVLGVTANGGDDTDILIIRIASGDLFALIVDRVLSHEELVVKPLADVVMQSGLYTGASLLDDGRLVLMMNIAGLAIKEGLLSEIAKVRRAAKAVRDEEGNADRTEPGVLFTLCDGRRRVARMDDVKRIIKVPATAVHADGGHARVVVDGAILPLEGPLPAAARDPDGSADHALRHNVLLLGEDSVTVAYMIDRVIDTVAVPCAFEPGSSDPDVAGVVLLDQRPVDLTDMAALRARHGQANAVAKDACRVDMDDEWTRTFLLPLLASAGYEPIGLAEPGTARLAILTEGRTAALPADCPVIRVADPADGAATGNTRGADGAAIARDDADSLLTALRQAAGAVS